MKKTATLILTALALAASTATAASARSYGTPFAPCPPFVSVGGRVDTCTPVQNALLGFLAKRVPGAHDGNGPNGTGILPTFLKGRLLTAQCGPYGGWYCLASTAVVNTAKVNGKLVRTRTVRKWKLHMNTDLNSVNPDPTNPPSPSPAHWGYTQITLLGSTSTRLA